MLLSARGQNGITVGGFALTRDANLKFLVTTLTGANQGSTWRDSASTAGAGYQVPAGKTFRVFAMRWTNTGVVAGSAWRLLYSDNDVGIASATAYVNPVYPGGSSTLGLMFRADTAGDFEKPFLFDVPAGKFPGLQNNTANALSGTFELIGYEY